MKRNLQKIHVHQNGETFSGTVDELIRKFEGYGYAAEKQNQSPHPYWNISEYLKRDK